MTNVIIQEYETFAAISGNMKVWIAPLERKWRLVDGRAHESVSLVIPYSSLYIFWLTIVAEYHEYEY
jgi:hypothetical protein